MTPYSAPWREEIVIDSLRTMVSRGSIADGRYPSRSDASRSSTMQTRPRGLLPLGRVRRLVAATLPTQHGSSGQQRSSDASARAASDSSSHSVIDVRRTAAAGRWERGVIRKWRWLIRSAP